ncbi:hypothetical protein CUMW_217480 [Citrus unshiu]|uniref:Uncharacterized protein n=1 Tax=Citrus unshiu TaxID=55188 RepID=A0A2H5QCT7_CITUN|nr:hypothetical protein CUMW_217480 [Citrus unshiu]
MSGDAAGLIENKVSGLDPWPVLLAKISMFLVFATTSKAKMMNLVALQSCFVAHYLPGGSNNNTIRDTLATGLDSVKETTTKM